MENEASLINMQRTHLWDYFYLHANQRITLLRFYTLLLGLFITSSGFVMIKFPEKTVLEEVMASSLCFIFFLLTVIFHLLDRRNRQLIHNAEEKIRDFEKKYFDEVSQIFLIEHEQKRNGDSTTGHTTCFSAIFCISYVLSTIILFSSIILACYYEHTSTGTTSNEIDVSSY